MKSATHRLAFVLTMVVLAFMFTSQPLAASNPVAPFNAPEARVLSPHGECAPAPESAEARPPARSPGLLLSVSDPVPSPMTAWAKTYGGTSTDSASSIKPTSDGGYIVAGHTFSFGVGQDDVWVLKLDRSGNVQWQKSYGGTGSDAAASIAQTGDGGFVLTAVTTSFGEGGYDDVWILKLDSSGNIVWQKSYGGIYQDEAGTILPTPDGGIVLTGWTASFQDRQGDAWVLKLDGSGNIQWQKAYGGLGKGDWGASIALTSDGGYVVAGSTSSFGAGYIDGWVFRLDSAGNILWQKTYGGTRNDFFAAIAPLSDGGFALAGTTNSFGAGGQNYWVVRLDGEGNLLWNQTYGGLYGDTAQSIAATPDGGYVVTGTAGSWGGFKVWTLKLDGSGKVVWQHTYGTEDGHSAAVTGDGGYIVAGDTSLGDGWWDAWVVKVNAQGGLGAGCTIAATPDAGTRSPAVTVGDSSATPLDTWSAATTSDAVAADTTASTKVWCASVEDTSLAVQYDGWKGVTDPDASGGGYRVSEIKGEMVNFAFTGTGITWVTQKGPEQGIARLAIDGIDKGLIDLYSPTVRDQIQVSAAGMQDKPHTLTITVTGQKNPNSKGTRVVVDAFVVGSTTTQEDDIAVQYDSWEGVGAQPASGGTLRYGRNKGTVASLTFTGTSVNWVTEKCPACGMAEVWIDGQDQGTVDLYAPSKEWQVVLIYGGLSAGQHTIKIEVLGTKDSNSSGTAVPVDAFSGPITVP